MEHLARVATLWNWLPGFRAVAETECVHAAARCLGVSPSSLSRTIRLLEGRLGKPLFERAGRTMRLTPLGHQLLAVVRDAMRAVDDAACAAPATVRVAAPRDLAGAFVLPALEPVRRAAGGVARVCADPDVDPVGRLLRGELDLVVGLVPLVHRRLTSEPAGTVEVGLYGAAEPAAPGGLDEVLGRPFVTYRAPGGVTERWPEACERAVALEVDDPRDAALAAAATDMIVALPDRLAAHLAVPLRRLADAPFAPLALHTARRRSLGPVHPVDELVAALRAAAGGRDVAPPIGSAPAVWQHARPEWS